MNKGETLIEFLVGMIILLVLLFALLIPGSIRFSQVGNGQHTGYVTAVDERGYIFRNYDVYFKTDTSSSQEDLYCVFRNDKLLKMQLEDAAAKKERVTITYHGVRGLGFGLCGHTQIDSVTKD